MSRPASTVADGESLQEDSTDLLHQILKLRRDFWENLISYV
jgi:hypothetical protein